MKGILNKPHYRNMQVIEMTTQNTIFKYQLQVTDIQVLRLPKNAKILSVQVQMQDYGQGLKETIQLWALVDKAEPQLEDRKIAMYGTGNPIPSDAGSYISTIQMYRSSLVFHFFEVSST